MDALLRRRALLAAAKVALAVPLAACGGVVVEHTSAEPGPGALPDADSLPDPVTYASAPPDVATYPDAPSGATRHPEAGPDVAKYPDARLDATPLADAMAGSFCGVTGDADIAKDTFECCVASFERILGDA